MTHDEALEGEPVTAREACRELGKHCVDAYCEHVGRSDSGQWWIVTDTDEGQTQIAKIGSVVADDAENGLVDSSEIMQWLGY